MFDPELALRLLAITFGVLYLPKLLSLILALRDPELRRGCGGVFGLVLCGVFVVVSGASLLYALNTVVHEMDDDMHIEAAYEVTMKLLVLLWNIIQLLNRLRR